MNIKLNRLAASLILAAATLSPFTPFQALAGGGHGHHGHDDHAEEESKGPHGGTLLVHDEFELEITVFEDGVPPEMRIYAYHHEQPVDPKTLGLAIELERLGGVVDRLSFTPEHDYLVSNQSIAEPHSYDVHVEADFDGEHLHWELEAHEGRTELTKRLLDLAGIQTQVVGPKTLNLTETLFGVIQPIQQQIYSISAPYDGIIESLAVTIGDRVKKGQTLATVRNRDTLQSYAIKAPADGEVTEQWLNLGDHTRSRALMQIADLSKVWVDLSAFPNVLEKITVDMPLEVYTVHDAESGEHGVKTQISYIAPTMTGGHIARVRAVLDNRDGHWRPGMHIQADITTEQRDAPLAVHVDALQKFRDMDVVFGKFGNTFEVRMLELGATNGDYVEVLGGIAPGTEYVTVNSYLLLADVTKDGAKHDH